MSLAILNAKKADHILEMSGLGILVIIVSSTQLVKLDYKIVGLKFRS